MPAATAGPLRSGAEARRNSTQYAVSSTSLCPTPRSNPQPPSGFCRSARAAARARSVCAGAPAPASARPPVAVAKTSIPVMKGSPPSPRSQVRTSRARARTGAAYRGRCRSANRARIRARWLPYGGGPGSEQGASARQSSSVTRCGTPVPKAYSVFSAAISVTSQRCWPHTSKSGSGEASSGNGWAPSSARTVRNIRRLRPAVWWSKPPSSRFSAARPSTYSPSAARAAASCTGSGAPSSTEVFR